MILLSLTIKIHKCSCMQRELPHGAGTNPRTRLKGAWTFLEAAFRLGTVGGNINFVDGGMSVPHQPRRTSFKILHPDWCSSQGRVCD